MPEHDAEQELGPKISDAFQQKAGTADGLDRRGMASEARRRVRKRRQTRTMAAAAVAVAVAVGGVWNAVNDPSPVATGANDSAGVAREGSGKAVLPTTPEAAGCPADHPILKAGHNVLPADTGLDVETPVQGLQACRYRLTAGATTLLGQAYFDAATARQVVDAIKVLPERNPSLPVFRCTPPTAQPSEAIVLRFDTAGGVREIWVEYDGCGTPGFFTGTRTFGLYPGPLKLFMKDTVRPTGGTYLDSLAGW